MDQFPPECLNCPSQQMDKLLDVADHFLTKEVFSIYRCPSCGLGKTYPIPASDKLSKYYDSPDYLSHGDDQKGLFAWLYRQAKKHNLSTKSRLLKSIDSKASHLLDYGCGTGDFLLYCQELGFQVNGAEPSSNAISHASPLVAGLIKSPEEELLSANTYDLITLWHVLEHIPDPRDIIARLRDKLNSGGHLIIAVPNPRSFDAQHYGAHWAGWDVPRHLWHFSPKSMIKLGEGLDLLHTSSHPMWLDAYYVSMLSERYRNGWEPFALWWATLSNMSAVFNKKGRCSSQIYVFKAK